MKIFLFIKDKGKKNQIKIAAKGERELENCDKSLWGLYCWYNDKRLQRTEQWEISHEPEANHLASEQRTERTNILEGKKAQGAGAEVSSFIQEQKVKEN